MKISLSELARIAGEATPGPWDSSDNFVEKNGLDAQRGIIVAELFTSNPMWGDCSNDTQFIAAFNPEVARRLVVGLQDAMKALKKCDSYFEDSGEYRELTNPAGECLERLKEFGE